jgi:hypothetical protein
MKILHLLSQRPDATGSGIYLQAMLREAAARRHQNFLVAGLPCDHACAHGQLSPDNCLFVRFESQDLPFPIMGMSDIMPYRSIRFRDLGDDALQAYEHCFAEKVQTAVDFSDPNWSTAITCGL